MLGHVAIFMSPMQFGGGGRVYDDIKDFDYKYSFCIKDVKKVK